MVFAMGLVTETGTGLPNANGYCALAFADAYHLERRNDAWNGANVDDDYKIAALIRATRFIDGAYRGRFPGYPLRGREQALEWPRTNATIPGYMGMQFYTLPQDAVPREIMQATCEAALRELVKPGSLSPDIKQGGAITSVQAGPVSVAFGGGGLTGQNTFQTLDLLLSPILAPVQAFGGRLGRC